MNPYSSVEFDQAVDTSHRLQIGKPKFRSFLVGQINGNAIYSRYFQHFESSFHAHASTDEMLIVQSGTLYIDIKDAKSLVLSEGNSYVVPAGVRHRLRAEELTRALVIRKALG